MAGLIAGLAIIAGAFGALASDLPSHKDAPQLPIIVSWTGFYGGANMGVKISDADLRSAFAGGVDNPAGGVANNALNSVALIGGLQAGANLQMNRFVLGVETDFQGTTDKVSTFSSGVTASKALGWFGTARGRVGYLIVPSVLVYGTGGIAYGHTNVSVNSWVTAFNDGAVRAGWTAGGGAEWLFMPKLSIKGEYLYMDLGREAGTNWTTPVWQMQTSAVPWRNHVGRIGVNYHF
jgi:outer membrane immunogenic protein